jgi:hypothetical protein
MVNQTGEWCIPYSRSELEMDEFSSQHTYGLTLVGKVGLLLPMLALGGSNLLPGAAGVSFLAVSLLLSGRWWYQPGRFVTIASGLALLAGIVLVFRATL